MAPWKESVQFGFNRSRFKNSVGGLPVSDFPMKDVIGFFFAIFPQNWRVGIEGAMWIHENREILIIHFDKFSGVGCGITVFGDYERDLLGLKQHFPSRQDHLLVMKKCRHPGQTGLFEVLASNDRENPRELFGFLRTYSGDPCVGVRASH